MIRRIIYNTLVDPDTNEPMAQIKILDSWGNVEELYKGELHNPVRQYTPEQQRKIDLCNTVLESKGYSHMDDEEISWMLSGSTW